MKAFEVEFKIKGFENRIVYVFETFAADYPVPVPDSTPVSGPPRARVALPALLLRVRVIIKDWKHTSHTNYQFHSSNSSMN